MSSIPTKQIDGDVAVGRNVTIGGKTTIRGSARVNHNLVIDGWLEAKNVKGPNKGLFKFFLHATDEVGAALFSFDGHDNIPSKVMSLISRPYPFSRQNAAANSTSNPVYVLFFT